MFLLWTSSSLLFGIYVIILELSIPLLIQPQIFGIISFFIYVQCFYYDSASKFGGNKVKSGGLFILMMMLLAGIEVGAVYGIRYANTRNISWPETVAGIIPVVILIIGYVPQYIKIYQEKRVIGISLIFMGLDILGNFISVLSLIFRPPPFDILAAFKYMLIFTLDSLIVFLYHFLNWYHSRKESAINSNRNEEEICTDNLSIVVMDDVKQNENPKIKFNNH